MSIASQNGGFGNTTTSVNFAAGLAHRRKRVLLIDVDYQANSSKVLLSHYKDISPADTIYATILEKTVLPVHDIGIPPLSIVPSHILLSIIDIELTTALEHREATLKNELDKIKASFEYIINDGPPPLSWLTINAFTASEQVMVVVSPGYFELDAIVQISKTITTVSYANHTDLLRVFATIEVYARGQ